MFSSFPPPKLWGQELETQAGAGLSRSWEAAAFDAQALCFLVGIVRCLHNVVEGVPPPRLESTNFRTTLDSKGERPLLKISKHVLTLDKEEGSLSLELSSPSLCHYLKK